MCAKKSQLKLQEYVISSYHLISEIKFTLISLHIYVYMYMQMTTRILS